MSNISIGVTATELFAYNPFRILGLPVDAPNDEIDRTYNKLVKMAESGDADSYRTEFDFDSLPPFKRDVKTLKTAYGKLASNGYRCFAYSDGEFSVSLNIDDIVLNLRDISCYDCFLRCYMWLIINDREMQERDLWIQLAAYIDRMINSSPEEWEKYFDHRFPAAVANGNPAIYKSFYTTFREIILLPIKEMVRGSMKCRTATDILICANIDVNEQFEFIDIPQSNLPKEGEPQPKLKLALKYGDEYFDITTGTMKSFSTETEAAESNSFAESASAPLAAEDLIVEEEPEIPEEPDISEEIYTDESEPEPEYVPEPEPIPEPEPVPEPEIIAEPEPVPEPEPIPEPEVIPEHKPVLPPRRRSGVGERKAPAAQEKAPEPKAAAPAPAPAEFTQPEPAKPTKPTAPARPEPAAQEPAKPSAPKQRSHRSMRSRTGEAPAAQNSQAAQTAQTADFGSGTPFFTAGKPASEPKASAKRATNGYTKLVKEAEKKEEERAAEELQEMQEDENLYTNALIEMLKSNQSRGETMMSVDTRHAINNGDKDLSAPAPTAVSMDSINMSKYDDKLLASPYELAPKKLTREERYRNIKIDDMLNPAGTQKNYGISPIEQYKKNKEKEKQNRKSLFAMLGVLAACLAVFLLMWYLGIIG